MLDPGGMILAEPIAIIGLACRFPGAPDPDSYWALLNSGNDAIGRIGPDRWAIGAFLHPRRGEPGFTDSFAAGVLDDVRSWDAEFFGLSPREASQMDPQQLLLLELAWEALEDAGIPPSRLGGSETAVFVGASAQDATHAMLGDMAGVGPHAMTGTALSILANRLSWAFDLKGESLTVDTACSSSLVALHQACAALASGRAEAALVGGVNLLLSPFPFIGFARAGMISPTGRCRPFSAEANGYVRSEGAAVLVLKPLAAARRAGDPIRAVIRATAANADGRTNGLALPDPAVQAALLRRIYKTDGIRPDWLGYLEAHGTGTPVGDPAEASAIGYAVGRARAVPLPIGSAKGHVGHLEAAAGMAGLVKAVLALEHRLVPPTLGAETPNPAIPFADLNLLPCAAPVSLAEEALIGVSSFGFGGANAHATLGPSPVRPAEPEHAGGNLPLVVSARTEAALRDLLRAWRDRLAAARAETSRAPSARRGALPRASPLSRRRARRLGGRDGSRDCAPSRSPTSHRRHHRPRLRPLGGAGLRLCRQWDAVAGDGARSDGVRILPSNGPWRRWTVGFALLPAGRSHRPWPRGWPRIASPGPRSPSPSCSPFKSAWLPRWKSAASCPTPCSATRSGRSPPPSSPAPSPSTTP
ncbi:MAG: polyketide synthase [Acetobacteraceae bacterium]|nr:polyketide synthase [Acetobacteraceae bacterium]